MVDGPINDATSGGKWLRGVQASVDARLERFFADKRARAAALTPEAVELVEAVEQLTMRGGKRLRPALLVAAYRATAPDRDVGEVADAGAALELLQAYLLIHDDWMDADEERRGGPSVHAALRDAHGGDTQLGASLAILAGNLASAHAWDLLLNASWPHEQKARAVAVFLAMHQEVVFGQQLDLLASEQVSLMQQLKTGSYTVRGPLLLGAALADATPAQRAALEGFGTPLGEAFQMRDDLLGAFGDPAHMGKPTGNDLAAGKRTALIRAAERSGSPAELLAIRAASRPDADGALEVRARALEALVSSGAKAAVEERLGQLLDDATGALEGAPLSDVGVTMLRELAERLALRDR